MMEKNKLVQTASLDRQAILGGRMLFTVFLGLALGFAMLAIQTAEAIQDTPAGDNAQESDAEATDLPAIATVEIRPGADLQQGRLDAVEAYLNNVGSMRARFVQQAPDGSLSRGIFHLERPGRARFEYDGDIPILIVADGRTLNLVDYELGQVTKWPVDDSPLGLLVADQISFGNNVTVVTAGPGELANMISITASDPKRPEHGTMTLIFSANPAANTEQGSMNLTLRGWQVRDSKGAFTTIRLSEPEVNLPLDAVLWTFEDPRSDRFKRRPRRR